MPKTSEAKILTLDIETAPLESYHWGLWDQNIGLEQIKTEWSILAYCAKWLGKKGLIYKDVREQVDMRKDHVLLQNLWKLLDEADIVIGQNVKRFDLKKINARMVMAGMPPYSPVRVIDTLDVAKKRFAFTSNKLQWTSQHLTDTPKLEHRKFPGFILWAECLKGNLDAWKEMEKYNKRDVVSTEAYYLRIRPWIENHPNLGVYRTKQPREAHVCPACDSTNTQKRGVQVTQAFQYDRYQCQACGSWSRARQRKQK